jgi:Na+-translocating ferredoxin:NAD+ oxidoreductase RnfG subunit
MFQRILLILIFVCQVTFSQEHHHEHQKVLHEVSDLDVAKGVYPSAAKIEKANDYWYKIFDGKNKLLGFAMSSMNYCKDVTGFSDATPVLIITDLKFVIKSVSLLSNYETPSFVNKLKTNGYFDRWDNKSLQDAKKVTVDGYTGATYTGKAVAKNVAFLVDNGSKSLPKKK